MNSLNDKTTRIIIIVLALVCVAIMTIFGISLSGNDGVPSSSGTPMEIPPDSISASDTVA